MTGIPGSIQRTIATFDQTQLIGLLSFVLVAVLTIAGVVFVTEGQRNIPVSYAKRVRGNRMYGGFDSHLPLRVNQAGMIPIIFAVSIVMLPSVLGQLLMTSGSAGVNSAGQFLVNMFSNQIIYGLVFFLFVVGNV